MIKLNRVEVDFLKFPNGETKLIEETVHTGQTLAQENLFEFKYQEDGDLIKLLILKKFIDETTVNMTNNLIIYYMPYSRMDRSEEGSAFTLRYIADFINGLSFDNVDILEPHSDVTPALVNKSKANYINFDLLKEVMKLVNFDIKDDYIMFPDLGASKRYKNMKTNNVLIGHKQRDFQTGEIKELQLIGDVHEQGRKAIIVDDISSYGGTFVYSSMALKEKGFSEVYLLVAHAENSIFEKDLFKHVDEVFTTNSLITDHAKEENKKFKLTVFEI